MQDKDLRKLVAPHGGYRKLKSYQSAEIIYDATVVFCRRLVESRSRLEEQMILGARSGKQNIAEGSVTSATSRESELRLVTVARASLEELLVDYQDFLRKRGLPAWKPDDSRALSVRKLAYAKDRSFETYRAYVEEGSPEVAANAMICLLHQTNYLLDRQLTRLAQDLLAERERRGRAGRWGRW